MLQRALTRRDGSCSDCAGQITTCSSSCGCGCARWYEAAVEAGLAAGKAAKAANQVEEAALSPLAADEIRIHELVDIPVMGETAAKAANVF